MEEVIQTEEALPAEWGRGRDTHALLRARFDKAVAADVFVVDTPAGHPAPVILVL